jgi:hypothetical protein
MGEFLNQINKLFTFLNLLDAAGNLSITNVAVIVSLIKLITAPQASITEVGALLLTLANYSAKRYTTANAVKNESAESSTVQTAITESIKQIEELKSTVASLVLRGK